jgi:hypothetical protein
MKICLVAVALAAAISMTGSAKSEVFYPYCSYSSGGYGGALENCGFVTLEQCYETARGSGDRCQANPRSAGPPRANEAARIRRDPARRQSSW